MHIKQVHVKNILSFKDAEFPLDRYTVIVGPNNSGKTNLLRILEMVAEEMSFEYFSLDTKRKMNPDEPSEMALTLALDEPEARMVFECMFGREGKIGQVPERLRTMRITIHWGKEQQESVMPKFVVYQFGDGYTLAVQSAGDKIMFDRRTLVDEDGYERAVDSWRTAESAKLADVFGGQSPLDFGAVEVRVEDNKNKNKDKVLRYMLKDKCFDSGTGHIVQGLPRSIHISAQATTPIARLLQKLGHSPKETNVTIGYLLNRIFARGFSAIREIRPPIKELAESLAKLRNGHCEEYDDMRSAFRYITGRAKILVKQDDSGEHILVVESGKRYDIKDSASGYYVLTYILSLLHGRPSRLVIIDEPETHLHPQMISRLHHILEERGRKSGIQTIVITHSPRFVTDRQIRGVDGSTMIVVTRPHTESLVHTDATESEPRIKPHLINPEIFFGKGSLIVEGPSDYFVQKAVSDFYDGWFEICDIVLMGGEGADSIPPLVELHRRFNIPYHCMADSDFRGKLERYRSGRQGRSMKESEFEDVLNRITILDVDLEAELEKIGIENVDKKDNHHIYEKMTEFLERADGSEWKSSGIWKAFEAAVKEAGGDMPPASTNPQGAEPKNAAPSQPTPDPDRPEPPADASGRAG